MQLLNFVMDREDRLSRRREYDSWLLTVDNSLVQVIELLFHKLKSSTKIKLFQALILIFIWCPFLKDTILTFDIKVISKVASPTKLWYYE